MKKTEVIRCSFCGKTQDQVDRIIAGNNSYICNECVALCSSIIGDDFIPLETVPADGKEEAAEHLPKPAEIRAVLDEYIIGQERAKIALSVAVYNHYKRILRSESDDTELQKSNILIIGPTGSGQNAFCTDSGKGFAGSICDSRCYDTYRGWICWG